MQEILLPRLGWSMDEGTFLGWLKRDGEEVKAGEPLFSIEGDKSAQEIEAIGSGTLRIAPNGPKVGDPVAVGSLLGHLLLAGELVTESVPTPTPTLPAVESKPRDRDGSPAVAKEPKIDGFVATPRARRLARERNINLARIEGTGQGGRIRERDLPHGTSRTTIARNMRRSLETTAPVTLTTMADTTALVALRAGFQSRMAEPDAIVPSVTDLIVKLTATALTAHPQLNSVWKDGSVEIQPKVNIGIAVDAGDTLLVPVIRDVPSLTIQTLARQTSAMVQGARTGALPVEAMRGGTFTVTNLGVYGIDAFTPIINWPECAILGVGAIREVPVVREGTIVIRKMVALSLTFDHRIVDGAPAARFLQSLVRLIEDATIE